MVALYGASREFFEQAWKDVIPLSWDETLEQAVRRLAQTAYPGEVILLAPAAASFDQYTDYMERGRDFKRIVEQINFEKV
jgi:UDP-N-acetylmuramoylalanine--D-glutamate ligase